MGAIFDHEVIEAADTQELRDKYNDLQEHRAYMCGHGGYTGTFAEAEWGLQIRPGTWKKEKAYEDCVERHEKWTRAWAYNLGNGHWFVGAWCSS